MKEPNSHYNKLRRLRRITDNYSRNHWDRDGIIYNTGRVISFTHFSEQNRLHYINMLSKDIIPNMPVFIVMASGTENVERYFDLDAGNNFILIDYEFKNYECIKNGDKRIIKLDLDAIVAIQIIVKVLKSMNMSVSNICSQNEGLNLGGGCYVLNTNLIMGLLLPVMDSNKVVIIGSKAYLKMNSMYNAVKQYNRLPYRNIKQLKNKEELLSFGINQPGEFFTTYQHSSAQPDFTILENKITDRCHSFIRNGVNINIILGSIFENTELDAYFIIAENTLVERLIRNGNSRIYDKRGIYKFQDESYDMNYPSDIIRLANNYGMKKIGFIPYGCADYVGFMNDLTQIASAIEEINFYHFHEGDYLELYKL